MKKPFAVLLLACLDPGFARGSPLSDEQFATTFRCPELFATDEDRDRATDGFLTWARSQHGDWTMDQLIAYRVRLLERHHCEKTLTNVHAHGQDATTRPDRAELLRSLGHELSRIRSSSSEEPAGIVDVPNIESLVGAAHGEIQTALASPDYCSNRNGGRCVPTGNWSYSFVKLPPGWRGGGAVLGLTFDADGKCQSARSHFER